MPRPNFALRSFCSSPWIPSLALVGLGAWLWAEHSAESPATHEAQSAPITLAQAQEAGLSNGTLLLDLTDPQQGEAGSAEEFAAWLPTLGAKVELAGPYAEGENLYRVSGTREQLAKLQTELANHPWVEVVEPELVFSTPSWAGAEGEALKVTDKAEILKPNPPRFEPNDPKFKLQWHFNNVNAPEAWLHTRGEGAVVAVIDTGVAWKDLQWGEINAKAVPDLVGIEFVHPKTFVPRAIPEGLDDHAHGTHVAGTIAQATHNGIGVAGVAHQAKIMPLKVLAGSGRGSTGGIANAVRFAADKGAHVINMSLGGPMNSRVLAKAVAYAHEKGTTVVCAAGNSGRGRVEYPAANDGCFSVAATTFSNQRSFYSNWGEKLDISAPGGDVRQDENKDGFPDGVLQNTIKIQQPSQNDYLWFMGTSMAAPHVAGVAALVAASGVTRPDEVERILKSTARHPNKVERDNDFGAGIVDAHAAVLAAKQSYAGERGLLGLLFGWLALVGGSLAVGGKKRWASWGVGAGVMALASGAFGPSLAYGAASLLPDTLGSGLWLSALVPGLLTVGLFHLRWARPLLCGLNIGFAALLAHGAFVLPTVMDQLPGGMGHDRLWLAVNAVVALVLARRSAR